MDNEQLIIVVATLFAIVVIGIVAVALAVIHKQKHPEAYKVVSEEVWQDETDTLPDADFTEATLSKRR